MSDLFKDYKPFEDGEPDFSMPGRIPFEDDEVVTLVVSGATAVRIQRELRLRGLFFAPVPGEWAIRTYSVGVAEEVLDGEGMDAPDV